MTVEPCRWAARSGAGGGRAAVSTRSGGYRWYLVLLSVVPMVSLRFDFAAVQQVYGVVGAVFVPGLALVLLLLNNGWGSGGDLRRGMRNGRLSNAVLVGTLVLTALLAVLDQALG